MLVVKNPPANAGDIMRCGFDPGVGKIPWRRTWQSTPVFLPGESHGQRCLAGYSPWSRRSRTRLKLLSKAKQSKHVKNSVLIPTAWSSDSKWQTWDMNPDETTILFSHSGTILIPLSCNCQFTCRSPPPIVSFLRTEIMSHLSFYPQKLT